MKRISLLLAFLIIGKFSLLADEGMWLPMLLQAMNEKEMQTMGMRISAEDIYSVNKSSLKDAIVLFGGGCTAEIVSNQGLILTNHHCGFGSIQQHSSLDHDYLTNGFWATSKAEELPNKGLSVTLLIRMEDVTDQVLAGVSKSMNEVDREAQIDKNIEKITKSAIKGTHYNAVIKPFYYGNKYYMFVNETFKDIRLVGAPPSNIGKFGGDTDNWMWPRHTGDFSMFRIYTAPDGSPAEYSKENIPYVPKRSLEISLKGYQKGDFTFVFGYPGRTQQFTTSQGIAMETETINPVAISMRDKRLEIIKQYMNSDPAIRIQYAAKAATIANAWKKWIGENRGIKRLNAIEKKRAFERQFNEWVKETPERQAKYGTLLTAFDDVYTQMKPYQLSYTYFSEAAYVIEMLRFTLTFRTLVDASQKKEITQEKIDNITKKLIETSEEWHKNYRPEIDKKIMVYLLSQYYSKHDRKFQPEVLLQTGDKYQGDFEKAVTEFYKTSIFANKDKLIGFLKGYSKGKFKKIVADPFYKLAVGTVDYYDQKIQSPLIAFDNKLDSLYRIYTAAIFEMNPTKRFYPDANLTLRVAYGKVNDYQPMDGVTYQYFTTLEGIMQKENPDIYDYVVEKKLKSLYLSKDYGRYGDKDGSMHVAFIASNHTTGGNSGSPVLNADGQLIGINFDRNWEGTMSDLMYDPNQCRNISLDIRYCLFIIDKFAEAKWLIDEMNIVKK
jgi:hypothetical protein